jgi:hypothetical protein
MENLNTLKMQELSVEELSKITGGKNIIEYASKALGWVSGKISNAWEDFCEGFSKAIYE